MTGIGLVCGRLNESIRESKNLKSCQSKANGWAIKLQSPTMFGPSSQSYSGYGLRLGRLITSGANDHELFVHQSLHQCQNVALNVLPGDLVLGQH